MVLNTTSIWIPYVCVIHLLIANTTVAAPGNTPDLITTHYLDIASYNPQDGKPGLNPARTSPVYNSPVPAQARLAVLIANVVCPAAVFGSMIGDWYCTRLQKDQTLAGEYRYNKAYSTRMLSGTLHGFVFGLGLFSLLPLLSGYALFFMIMEYPAARDATHFIDETFGACSFCDKASWRFAKARLRAHGWIS